LGLTLVLRFQRLKLKLNIPIIVLVTKTSAFLMKGKNGMGILKKNMHIFGLKRVLQEIG